MLRTVIIYFLFVRIIGIFADCYYDNYEENQPGIFLRPYGNDTIIFNPKGSFRIPEEGHVKVYCFSGIENNEFDEWGQHLAEEGEKIKNLTIRCNKHKLDYKIADRSKIAANTKIRCGGTNANFYKNPIEYCPYDGFVFGLPIMDKSVVLLELCFEFHIFDYAFIRYSALKRSQFLEEQEQYNPSNIPLNFDEMQKFIFPNRPQYPKNSYVSLTDERKFRFTSFAGSAEYELAKLVHFEKYTKLFEKFLGDTTEINTVIWWSSLLHGNWKIFEQLLEKESLENDIDVFAGKSGIVTYPYDEKCTMTNELIFEIQGIKRTVPLLIWHYVRQRETQKDNEGVVIVGVNSPFFEGYNYNATNICKDICDQVSWLGPLIKTRKMSAFGYVFCCNPADVKDVLDGFPISNYIPINKLQPEVNVVKRFIEKFKQI